MTKGIVFGILSFILFMLHVFIFRYFNIKRRFFVMVIVFICGLVLYPILFFMLSERSIQKLIEFFIPLGIFSFINALFLYFFLYFFYLHLIEVIDRSPSTRIMEEIEKASKKRLAFTEIKSLYSLDRKTYTGLEDMVSVGCLKKESDFYIITTKGKFYSRIFRFMRHYLKLDKARI